MLKGTVLLFMVFCFSTFFAGCSPVAATNEILKDGEVIKHSILHQEAGRFCGWPANNGVWNWGDEIVVGFHLKYYKESIEGHSINRNKPTTRLLARSLDGGKTIRFLSWIGPEPITYDIMPSTVRLSANELVASIRHYDRGDIRWGRIDIYRSTDNGLSWEYLGPAAETGDHSGNPPSMLKLRDGRLCLTYCFRTKPHSVRAKFSSDGGKTWGDVIHLRDDGRTWDIGYMRTVERADGKLVSMYYYTTENDPEQHIAATIWDPSKFD